MEIKQEIKKNKYTFQKIEKVFIIIIIIIITFFTLPIVFRLMNKILAVIKEEGRTSLHR